MYFDNTVLTTLTLLKPLTLVQLMKILQFSTDLYNPRRRLFIAGKLRQYDVNSVSNKQSKDNDKEMMYHPDVARY